MKYNLKQLLLLAFVLINVSVYAQYNAYWVGGTGNWNDQLHWASTSGGTGGSLGFVPNGDNATVIFDHNSFTATGQTVSFTVNNQSYRSIIWSGIRFNPTWNIASASGSAILSITDKFILHPDLTISLNGPNKFDLYLFSLTGQTTVIRFAGKALSDLINRINLSGTFSLLDDKIEDPNLNIELSNNATIDLSGKYLNLRELVFSSGANVHFNKTRARLHRFIRRTAVTLNNSSSSWIEMDGTQAEAFFFVEAGDLGTVLWEGAVEVTNNTLGSTINYKNLIVDGTIELARNHTTETLSVKPGSSIASTAYTNTVKTTSGISIHGTEASPISLSNFNFKTNGYNTAGSLTLDYVNITDVFHVNEKSPNIMAVVTPGSTLSHATNWGWTTTNLAARNVVDNEIEMTYLTWDTTIPYQPTVNNQQIGSYIFTSTNASYSASGNLTISNNSSSSTGNVVVNIPQSGTGAKYHFFDFFFIDNGYTIEWNDPGNITSTTPLSSTQLNAIIRKNGQIVNNGTFNYSPAAGTLLTAGIQELTLSYSSIDGATLSKRVLINVSDLQTPTLTLTNPNGTSVVYGNTLTGFQLTENSDGAVSWSVEPGTTNPGEANFNPATNTLTATKVGNVILKATTAQTATYAQGTASLTITITQRGLTITGTTVQTTKEYNRSESAQIINAGTLNGVLAADVNDVQISVGTATYNNFNVGTNKPISFTGFGLTGSKAGNYILSAQPTGTTASIIAKPVNITGVTIATKPYDGTTSATITSAGTVNGLIVPDALTSQAGTATFADANVGTNKQVNLTGFSITGSGVANYVLNAQPTTTGTIEAIAPVVQISNQTLQGVVGNTLVLTATTGGSSGTVTFERTNNYNNSGGSANLAGNTLTFTQAGQIQVRANIAASGNYAAASSQWVTITILLQSPVLHLPVDADVNVQPSTTFVINNVDNLNSIEYQIDTDNDFGSNTADALNGVLNTGGFTTGNWNGTLRHWFVLHNLKFGKTYYWRVKVSTSATNTSNWSNVRIFSTLSSPVIFSPANQEANIEPSTTFILENIENIQSIEYQFDTDNDFSTNTADALNGVLNTGGFTTGNWNGTLRHWFVMSNFKFGKTYYWRVRVSTSATNSSNWSTFRSFSTIASPIITAPNANAVNVPTAGTTLTWQDLTGESGYEVQLSTSNLYESFVVNAAQTTTTRTTGALAANTTYYWRVRAKITTGGNDFYSAWSERVFSTGATIATPPASPNLTAPTNNATNQIFTPTLTWSVVAGASYEYQYSTDQNFLTNITTGTTSVGTNQYQTPALAEQTTYYWRVRAIQNNLASAWSATFNFTTKRNVTIAFSNTEPVYDGTAKGITVTTTPAGVAYTIAYTQGGNTIANPTNAGDYLATVTITDNTYQLTNANTATLSIKQRPTTLAFANTTHTYDGTAKTLTVTTTPTGVPHTVAYTPVASPINAGTYTATVTLTSANHVINGSNTTTLTINAATPTVAMSSANTGVVNSTMTLTANTGGSTGAVTFEKENLTGSANLTGNQLELVALGQVRVRAIVAASADGNYAAATSPWQTITISNLLTPTISLTSPNGTSVVYGNTLTGFQLTEDSDGAVSWSVEPGATNPGEANYNPTTNTLTATKVGNVILKATTAQTATYAQGTASLAITITQRGLTITGTTVQTSKEYNRNESAQITNAGTLNGVLAADANDVQISVGTATYNNFNVGTNKPISFTGFGLTGSKAGNYTLTAQPAGTTGTITAKPVTITGVTIATKPYDGTTAATVTNAGTVNGVIAPDALTAQAGTATFADANAGTNKTVNLTGFTLAGGAAVLSNYTLSAQPTALTNGIINQETLTAVAENKSRMYGQPNPTLTIQYTGFVNNETAAVLDQPIQIATTATPESNVGTYPITLTGGVDNNYAINKGNGTLTITQSTQTITVNTQPGSRALSNGTFTVEATASSNLPLTVTSSNPAIASVNGNTITMHQLGEVNLTFSQAGNQNYLPAPNVTRTFTIVNETRVIGLTTEALVEPVIVGFPHLRLITVSNTGNAPLTVSDITHSAQVTVDDTQFTVAAGASHTVAATLIATEAGLYHETIVFVSDATSGTTEITLNGEAFLITDAEESQNIEVKVGPNPSETYLKISGKLQTEVLIKDLQGKWQIRNLTKSINQEE